MLLINSNHTQNSVKRLRYSAVIFQIDTLTWIFWRRAILHITWQKVRKELFHWTVIGSQNLILLANILTTNKSRVPNLLSFTIVVVERKWKIDNLSIIWQCFQETLDAGVILCVTLSDSIKILPTNCEEELFYLRQHSERTLVARTDFRKLKSFLFKFVISRFLYCKKV